MINHRSILNRFSGANAFHFRRMVLLLTIVWWLFPLSARERPLNFRTINISNGLSHNMIHAIYKDHRGFVWLGTQLGLDRFDGISVVNYPQLKEHSIFAISEIDSVHLWVGIDKGLMKLNRQTEKAEYVMLDEKQPAVRALYPVSPHTLLVGTLQGLFIMNDDKADKISFGVDALSTTNSIYGIIEGKEDKTYWIATQSGLVHFDLNTRTSIIYRYAGEDPDFNNYYCLAMHGDMLYIGMKNVGVVTFDTQQKRFKRFPYKGNPYITTLSVIGHTELCIGTNGGGLNIVSMQTGEVLESVEHTSDGNGISSNAIYSFLKDGNTYWVGTYMGGLNYTPVIGDKFSVYVFENTFNSRHHNVRSFRIADDGRKFIGTRDGFNYISEREHVVRRYTSKNSMLQADIILSVYPLNDKEILVGTYGGGLYTFNSTTLTLSFFGDDERFRRGSFFSYVKDAGGNLWISSSHGVFVYNPETDGVSHYTNANSNLKSNLIFASCIDSNQHIWYGTDGGVCMYDPTTKVFRSDMFPPHIQSCTGSVRFIFEDSHKNLWFCDDKEGVVKVDKSFGHFEHYTTADFLPSNSVMSILEDKNGGLWFSTQRGLLYYRDNGKDIQFYSLYDGIPGYIFNNPVQETADGTIWWGNEQGLVYYNENEAKERTPSNSPNRPVITAISVAGKTLHAGDEHMPYAPAFMKEMSMNGGQSIEFTFSALNYSQVNTDMYEYQLEGYDKGWQVLMTGNKVSYTGLPFGKYIFKVKSSSNPEQVASLTVHVRRNIPMTVWLTLICAVSVILLLFFYSRLLAKYRQKHSGKNEETGSQKEKYAKARMEDTEVNAMRIQLLHYMKNKKPYLNPELKLQDVSHAIGCSSVELSQLLNVHLDTNFADFVNQYRIDEFMVRVQDKSAVKYTLASLSEQSGFSSRTSFFRSFKKIKGTTPAEYIKEMGVELKK
jgi:ligand-binding sensor domain-containing protein/AraC-like DNA-binding protein